MCNNNGACRKSDPGVMCPSYRVTMDERHVTRGRANTLRLALTGQLGPDALTSEAMAETMALCVGCKGCKRECPTGVDMARMKIEYLHQRRKRHGLALRDRAVAWLPRYAPAASRLAWMMNLRDRIPGLPAVTERLLGLSAKRTLPRWRTDPFRAEAIAARGTREFDRPPAESGDGSEVALFADTFTTWFEPENARAAVRVLEAAGYRVRPAAPPPGERRPLCCGRTFLAAGLVEEAKREMARTLSALAPFIKRGVPVVGLEPSCLLTFRDEALVLGFEREASEAQFLLFEEFVVHAAEDRNLDIPLHSLAGKRALLHGHCHQKAFGVMPALESTLRLVPGLEVETIASSCCGMAGAFGYETANYETSMAMGELNLLPAVRAADRDALIVAGGTSCRHQIADGAGRDAWHIARVLEQALAAG